jgi:hypothetical protein
MKTLGWLFHTAMPACGLGQNTPPWRFRLDASSSTVATGLEVAGFVMIFRVLAGKCRILRGLLVK